MPRQPTKKEQRKAQAQHRKRLKPLTDKVRKIETQLAARRAQIDAVELRLADEGLYTDHQRKDELKDLVRQQADARAEIQTLEWHWLEASEALEKANS